MTSGGDASAPGGHRGPPPLRLQLLSGLAGLQLVVLLTLAFAVDRWLAPPAVILLALAALIAVDTALLVVFTHVRLRRLVLRPVERLIEGSERLASGDEEYRMPFVGSAELDLLGAAIVRMARRANRDRHRLAANIASLNETNRALSEARSELIRAEKLASIGRLAAGIAHEVGNPLGAILGYVELGKRQGDAGSDWTEGISHEVRRIDRIVRGLLDYARPKAAATRRVDVNAVVRSAAELLRIQGRLKDATLGLELAEPLPEVVADPSQLEQVLVNLLLNADDAIGGEAHGRVQVRTAETTSPGTAPDRPAHRADDPEGIDYSHLRRLTGQTAEAPAPRLRAGAPAVEILVEDSGPGIRPEDRTRVFDPFFTTKEPGRGTGLGLAVSARLIDGMGGTIEVAETTGRGAAFRVILPVAREEVA
ncbi:MAG: sensor histidine kinase [Gemmatimonadota bacterium]